MRLIREDVEEAKFQMAPMIDMVFLLLVFFMCASQISQNKALQLELPVATKGVVPKERPTRWIVNIFADGQLFSGDRPCSVDELKAEVSRRLREEPNTKIYLRADAKAEYRHIKKVLEAMASIGVDDFIFAVFNPSESALSP